MLGLWINLKRSENTIAQLCAPCIMLRNKDENKYIKALILSNKNKVNLSVKK